jgi:hypothetical protein
MGGLFPGWLVGEPIERLIARDDFQAISRCHVQITSSSQPALERLGFRRCVLSIGSGQICGTGIWRENVSRSCHWPPRQEKIRSMLVC